jgi:hypothetical protein
MLKLLDLCALLLATTAGNIAVDANTIQYTNQWKRTYAPPLGFWGSGANKLTPTSVFYAIFYA